MLAWRARRRNAVCMTPSEASDRRLTGSGRFRSSQRPCRHQQQKRPRGHSRSPSGQESGRRTSCGSKATLLALAWLHVVMVAGLAAAAVPADDTYSGESYITPERYPCHPDFKCGIGSMPAHANACG